MWQRVRHYVSLHFSPCIQGYTSGIDSRVRCRAVTLSESVHKSVTQGALHLSESLSGYQCVDSFILNTAVVVPVLCHDSASLDDEQFFQEMRGGAVPCVLVVFGLLALEVAVLLSVFGVWVISKATR